MRGEEVSASDPYPRIGTDGLPWCQESCQQYDGKRCQLLGLRPGAICEPEVLEIIAAHELAEARLARCVEVLRMVQQSRLVAEWTMTGAKLTDLLADADRECWTKEKP